jgi:hypothetical protein
MEKMRLRHGVADPPTSSDKVKERAELYLYPPSSVFRGMLEDEVYFTSLLELLASFYKTPRKTSKIGCMEYFASLGLNIEKFTNKKGQGNVKLYSVVRGAKLDSRRG